MSKKLMDAYVARGRDGIEADAELRAQLGSDPEFLALMERAESLDLRDLPKQPMPEELVWRIQHAARARRRERRFWGSDFGYDMALAAAVMLLALIPPAVGAWLLQNHSVEISVLELAPSTVRLLPQLSVNAPGAVAGGRLQQVSDAPTARLVVDGSVGKKLDGVAHPLAEGRLPERTAVHVEALVNAVPFPAPAELTAEAGPTPWSAETRLLRVQVTARQAVSAGQLEVAFHLDRVASYRLLSAAAGPDSTPSGRLEAGESFVALFEIVPKATIGAGGAELATVRFRGGGEQRAELEVRETRGRFDKMPAAYRFAAAAALFGLTLQGEGDARSFDRALLLASQALPRRADAKAFLAMISAAQTAR